MRLFVFTKKNSLLFSLLSRIWDSVPHISTWALPCYHPLFLCRGGFQVLFVAVEGLLVRLPTQDGFAGGGGFIQTRDAGIVRRSEDELRVFFDLFGDGLHGVDKEIKLLFRFTLGGLDHQRAGDDQRERRRIRMEAVVDEALGDVAGLHAFGSLQTIAEDNLMHRSGLVRKIVKAFELLADVVGVEDSIF